MPYSSPIVTIDIDGVLADTGYVPKTEQGAYEHYQNAKPFPEAYEFLHWLYQRRFEVWFLSSRSFSGAQAITEAWVHHHFGNLNPWYHKKVLTGLHDETTPKVIIANELHSVLHIDDDWRVFVERRLRWVPRVSMDYIYKRRPFAGTGIWVDNWKNKDSIPDAIEYLIDDTKLWRAPTLKEALEIVQSITPNLLGKTSRK